MADEVVFGAANVPAIKFNFDTWLGTKSGDIVVPEPSTEQVVRFWSEWQASLSRARAATAEMERELPKPPENETADQRDERIMAEEAAGQLITAKFMDERRALLAAVCSDVPNVDTLVSLPFRVQRAFEGYVAAKLSPEA